MTKQVHTYEQVKYVPEENKWELRCPICDRHVIVITEPFQRIILNYGDPGRGADGEHNFGSGGLVMGSVEVAAAQPKEDDFWSQEIKKMGLDKSLDEL